MSGHVPGVESCLDSATNRSVSDTPHSTQRIPTRCRERFNDAVGSLPNEMPDGIVELSRGTFSAMLAVAHPQDSEDARWLDADLINTLIKDTGYPVLVIPYQA